MSTADWWSKQLNIKPASKPADIPMPPSQQPMTKFPTQQQPTPTTKAQSASQVLTCPDCNSNNYMSVANATPRCYDCGYPIQQSGSKFGALTGAHVEGSAKSARGNEVQSNWNPQGIIGRIN